MPKNGMASNWLTWLYCVSFPHTHPLTPSPTHTHTHPPSTPTHTHAKHTHTQHTHTHTRILPSLAARPFQLLVFDHFCSNQKQLIGAPPGYDPDCPPGVLLMSHPVAPPSYLPGCQSLLQVRVAGMMCHWYGCSRDWRLEALWSNCSIVLLIVQGTGCGQNAFLWVGLPSLPTK